MMGIFTEIDDKRVPSADQETETEPIQGCEAIPRGWVDQIGGCGVRNGRSSSAEARAGGGEEERMGADVEEAAETPPSDDAAPSHPERGHDGQ